ncbi:MAG: membrane integrity-associated transporter subunit PqiC [Burkholderiaceae bacterium]|nr:membrane integrity-associated transporter subunit PqiC [Burkholderiaceae bacterium]
MKFYASLSARLVLALSVVVLSACSVLPASKTLTVYQLPVVTAQTSDASNVGAQHAASWALRVDTPYSSQLINSQRILVQPPGDAISVYQGARWSDVAPVMLRDHLVDAYRVQAPMLVVSSDSSRLLYDVELTGDLTQFQVVYGDSGPVVHIQLDASMVQADGKRTLASRRFTVQHAVDGTKVPEVVTAFGLAADALATQLIAWTLQHAPLKQ